MNRALLLGSLINQLKPKPKENNMKLNWLISGILAAVMLLCGTSFASPQSDGTYSEPMYDNSFVLATWPPLVPVNKLDDNGTFTAMAGGPTDNNKDLTPTSCMASCHSDERMSIGLSWHQLTTGFKTVLVACGYESEPMSIPGRVSIAV